MECEELCDLVFFSYETDEELRLLWHGRFEQGLCLGFIHPRSRLEAPKMSQRVTLAPAKVVFYQILS
jgi:hypothetical protein